jgi:hypothetical protein
MPESESRLHFLPPKVRWYGLLVVNFLKYSRLSPFSSNKTRQRALPRSFDSSRYLEHNPDVRLLPLHADTHYLMFGRYRGRAHYGWKGLNEPGLHPEIFRLKAKTPWLHDPNTQFLLEGKPEGPWQYPLVNLDERLEVDASPSAALHIHVYYTDLLPQIFEAILGNDLIPDIFVTTLDDERKAEVEAHANGFGLKITKTLIVQNRGRNFGGLTALIESGAVDSYEIIGHVHTKRTFGKDGPHTTSWRDFLMANLIGSEQEPNVMGSILKTMTSDKSVGLVYPDDPKAIGWDRNEEYAVELAQRVGLTSLPIHIKFPAGGMFWARAEYLRNLRDIGLVFDELLAEPVPLDGSTLHAIERLIGVLPEYYGFTQCLVRIPGVHRYPVPSK